MGFAAPASNGPRPSAHCPAWRRGAVSARARRITKRRQPGGTFPKRQRFLRKECDDQIPAEDLMARYRWHADYFDGDKAVRSIRSAVIQADNADDAAKIARAEMGACRRVEVRRAATTAPVRVIYAREESVAEVLSPAGILSWASAMSTAPV
jgi:hypothetical protein